MIDFPSAVAPIHTSLPICLECYCLLPADNWIECPKCGFPLCSQECAGGQNHAKECSAFARAGIRVDIGAFKECSAFARAGIRVDIGASASWDKPAKEYQCLMLLRLLLTSKEELERVDLLTHHAEKLSKDEKEVYCDGVVDMVQMLLGSQWSKEQLLRYISVIRTNAGTISGGKGKGGKKVGSLRLLHPSLATMNHSCLCNTRVHHRADFSVCVRAQTRIKKGEEVFNKYVALQEGRLDRHSALSKGWHFDCDCPRCDDPTDLGAHSDTLICRCAGFLLPQAGLNWLCKSCGAVKEVWEVSAIEEEVLLSAEAAANTTGEIEEFLEKESRLHSGHHVIRQMKRQLVKKYSREQLLRAMCGTPTSRKQVEKQISLCRELMSCVERTEPGLSQARVQLLQELSLPLLVTAKQDLLSGDVVEDEVFARTNEVKIMLEEVLENYKVFEEGSESEVVVAQRMLEEAKKIKEQFSN